MGLRTALTEMFGIDHPVVLAPMGDVAGGALAAAVSEGGGLGVIGAGRGDLAWLGRECDRARAATRKPWGIGFLSWAIDAAVIDAAIEQSPAAIMLSFGDPAPFADAIRAAGIPLIVQVTTLAEARRALDVGANVVVAQGSEAGGHGGGRATLPFVPAVVDIAGSVPVLAAGGIADGRGLAAALVLGAAGAVIGTRFEATHEALITPDAVKAIIAAGAEDTTRGRALDVVRDSPWPERYPGANPAQQGHRCLAGSRGRHRRCGQGRVPRGRRPRRPRLRSGLGRRGRRLGGRTGQRRSARRAHRARSRTSHRHRGRSP